jgi:glucosylceramidase
MYLGPRFVKDKISSQIWFSTINNANVAVFDSVLSQPNVRKYISGVGFQYEGKDALVAVAKKYPELNLMQTETPCGNGSFDWKSAESTFKEIKLYVDRGVKSYMYWNMILDTTGESTWGWRQNAQVTIDKITKKVTYTPEFYIFKHLSYFVVPGSVKLQTKGRYGDVLSFVTPEGKIVLVTINMSNNPVSLKIKVGTKMLDIILPEKSFNTLTI